MNNQRQSAQVIEVEPEETARTYSAFRVLREDRAIMVSPDTFTSWVNEKQRPQGYRIVGAFLPQTRDAVAAAGFRVHCMLSRGPMLYVDDLVTIPDFRSSGYAGLIFEWLIREARRLGCEQLHLDSGHQRYDAHRFYLKHGIHMNAHHFSMALN